MGEVEGSDWGVGGGGKEFVDWLLWFVMGWSFACLRCYGLFIGRGLREHSLRRY